MEPETGVSVQYDLAVDFMDMTDAHRLWTRGSDAAARVRCRGGRLHDRR